MDTARDARQHRDFGLRQGIRRIGRKPTGVPNIRSNAAARSGVTERHVADMVHRQRTDRTIHPVQSVIENLLLHRGRVHVAAGDVDLGPLDSGWGRRTLCSGGVIYPKRLNPADVAILVLHHRAIGQRIDVVARRLRHGAGRADVTRLRNVHRSDECRVARNVIVRMKFVDVPRVGRH